LRSPIFERRQEHVLSTANLFDIPLSCHAVAFVDAHLAPTIDFMNARGFTHFDAHFENITTDGRRFCFSDFGLALSSDFELTGDEVEFAGRHVGTITAAPRWDMSTVSSQHYSAETDGRRISAFLKNAQPAVPAAVAAAIRRQAPLALAFLEFSRQLLEEDKQTPYPTELQTGRTPLRLRQRIS